ncbi:MAG: FtsX-like permease family protein, partial [Chloroflexi bacterium]|nr:FtsX-like permease family protein [Chloroflexota bacterium]
VIMIVSLGNGLRRSTQLEMEAWASGTMEIRAQYWGPVYIEVTAAEEKAAIDEQMIKGGGIPAPRQARALEPGDVEALRRLATSVVEVAPQLETYTQAVYRGQWIPFGGIVGTTREYLQVYRSEIKYGRFFTAEEEEEAAPVLVLDETLVNYVFGAGVNPVGEVLHITLENIPQNYTIIGVLAKRRGIQGIAPRAILAPLRTVQMRLYQGAKNEIGLIAARVDSRVPAERRYAVAEINTILRARRGIAPGVPADFWVQDTLEFSEEQLRIIRTITMVLSLIAGISLVVGSIGLMNIMLVGVAERTWEIGLRRAIGAHKSDILLQFLSEGVTLALAGGVGGLVLGLAGSYAGSRLIGQLRGLATVTPDVFVIAVGVSLAVGIVASIYPAWQAANLQPTAALRRG